MTHDDLDAYAVLGVAPDASQEELKDAHRRLVRRHHPDLAAAEDRPAATRRVQRINVAYGLVRDPKARAAYDRIREQRRAQRTRSAPLDRAAAAAWESLVGDAGRWAGRWWRLNRGRARRAAIVAAMRARRGTIEVVSRLQVLALAASGALAGFALAVVAGRLLGVATLAGQLVGVTAGWWLGTERGQRRRVRRLGLPAPLRSRWLAPAWAAAAISAALALDVALG